jgi:hypothetical protein
MLMKNHCVYRKLKPGRNDDEAHLGSGLLAGALPARSTSNANSAESRPDATAPAFQVGTIVTTARIDGNLHLDEEPAVVVGRPSAPPHPAPQDDQLMSEHRILRLKPALRLERRGQHGQSETEQPDHSASLDVMSVSRARRFPWWAGARGRSPIGDSVRKLNDRSRPEELGGPPCVCKNWTRVARIGRAEPQCIEGEPWVSID